MTSSSIGCNDFRIAYHIDAWLHTNRIKKNNTEGAFSDSENAPSVPLAKAFDLSAEPCTQKNINLTSHRISGG